MALMIHMMPVRAQSNFDAFNALIGQGDTALITSFLAQWEQQDKGSADLYAAKFNYHVWLSMEQVVNIGDTPKGENFLELTPADSTGSNAQYMYADFSYRPSEVAKAMEVIDAGINRYPNRLDLRFGKVYLLGETKNYHAFAEEVVKAFQAGVASGQNWLWTNNQTVPDGEAVMLSSVQDYIVQLFDTETDSLGEEIGMIASAVLAVYPNNIENLSNLSIAYMLTGKFSEALIPLKQAEAMHPQDAVILSNIAWCYLEMKDEKNATAYYEKVMQYGDPEMKEFAAYQLEQLKNK